MKHFFLLPFLVGLAACFAKSTPIGMGDADWGIEVTWHGHSCFTLKDSLGRVLVIDPFDETVGYDQVSLRADALLITHGHFDHNFQRSVKSKRMNIDLVNSTGTSVVAGGQKIVGLASDHDNEGGQIHGPNIIYTFTMGSLRIAHLGDLGQKELTPYQLSNLGSVDVLFVPVGGFTTIGPKDAKKIVEALNPSMVFPMHYGDIRFFSLAPVSEFTQLFPKAQIKELKEKQVRIQRADFTKNPQILTLTPVDKNY